MKIVKEHINEKFEQGTDPIWDLGIGSKFTRIKKGDIIIVKQDLYQKNNDIIFDENIEKVTARIRKGNTSIVKEVNKEKNILSLVIINFGDNVQNAITARRYIDSGGYYYTYGSAPIEVWDEYFDVLKINESVNEKFAEDTDPIQDMGIGIIKKIKDWLKEMNIIDYTINKDLSITVQGQVNLYCVRNTYPKYKKLPEYIKFHHVYGNFCVPGTIQSCIGFPEYVKEDFNASDNDIRSLKGFPKRIDGTVCMSMHYGITEAKIRKICKVKMPFYE